MALHNCAFRLSEGSEATRTRRSSNFWCRTRRCGARTAIGMDARISRDFTPDFDGFREAAQSPREWSGQSSDTRTCATTAREESLRPELRFREVREPRPKEVPPRDSRAVLYDRYRGYELHESCRRADLSCIERKSTRPPTSSEKLNSALLEYKPNPLHRSFAGHISQSAVHL